jgi:hypothetical protein
VQALLFLLVERVGLRGRFKLQASFSLALFWCSLMPSLLGGVQSPAASATKKQTDAQLIPSCAPAFLFFYLLKTVGYVNFSDPINPTTPGKE